MRAPSAALVCARTPARIPALIFFLALLLKGGPSLPAFDNGLNLTSTSAWEDYGFEGEGLDKLLFRGSLIPWFSIPLGAEGDLYISAGITAEYEDQKWRPLPELLRSTLTLRLDNSEFILGRMAYQDPLGLIAQGLFDGINYNRDLGIGSLGIGLWYTGLLYKKNTTITMTEAEEIRHIASIDYSDFQNTYFTSRRLLAAVDFEHPGLGELVRLRAALLGQFDLNDDSSFNSQYLAAKALLPLGDYVFDLGGSISLTQDEDSRHYSLAADGGVDIFLPTAIHDSLRFSARYASGIVSDSFGAFVPLTTVAQGHILKAKFSGLSIISLSYNARLHQSFSIGLYSSYFILNDMGTYFGIPYNRDGYFLGNEFYAQALWSPASDLQLRASGGVFLPALGNADPQSAPLWRVELNLVFSVL